MSLHSFVANDGPGVARIYYGNAAPSAPDGNTYQINDVIENIGFPFGTAVTAGSPSRWICTTGGAGGTAVFAAQGNNSQASATTFKHVYAGGYSAATQTTGTDTAGINGTVFISEVFIPSPLVLTGVSFLVGSVGGTDKAIAFLFDSTGAVLATSALAGTTVGTTALFQRLPFTATLTIAGSGLYFLGVQYNGTTAKIRTQAGGDASTVAIAQTFGTPVAIAVPTTFTVSTGPVAMLY